MVKILHYLKDPKLWELRYIPYYGQCRILTISSITKIRDSVEAMVLWGFGLGDVGLVWGLDTIPRN